MRLLREFIRENLGSMFGLDRHVTINALKDVAGGPDPGSRGPMPGMFHGSQDHQEINVLSHLMGNPINDIDELESDLDDIAPQGDQS